MVMALNRSSGQLLPNDENESRGPKRKPRRARRLYTLYATDSQCANVTTDRRLHQLLYPWKVLVTAVHTKQAFRLTYDRTWAAGPKEAGIHRIEHVRWHHEATEAKAREDGLILEAPYLRREQDG